MTAPREQRPYDIELTHNASGSNVSKPYMLITQQDGSLMWQRGLAPEIAPQQRNDAFSYEHRLPSIDLPASFEDWSMGAGFEDAPDVGTLGFKGYNYSQGVDLSWHKRAYLSPLLQTGGSTTQAPKKFLWTSFGLFAMTARYLYEWTGSWTQRLDTGGTVTNHDLIEFSTSSGRYLLLGVSGRSYYLSADGIFWVQPSTAGSAPSLRADSHDAATAATSVTATEPSGAASTDILIACVAIDAAETISPPIGWTEIVQLAGNTGSTQFGIWWIRRGSAAPSLTWTWTSSVLNTWVISAYQNVITSGSPFDPFTSAAWTESTGTTHNTGTATALGTNRTALAYFIGSDDAGGTITWTAPAGFTEREDTGDEAGPTISTNDDVTITEGAQSAAAATSSGSVSSLGILLLLKPIYTGAHNVARWDIRSQSSGDPVLWALDVEGDIRNSVDPTLNTGWSAADSIQMGQASINIAGLCVIDNIFYLVHEGGITAYDGTTVSTVWDNDVMRLTSDQARPAVGPDNMLYFAFGGTLLRLDITDNTIMKLWPRGPQVGNTELNGTITAINFDVGDGYFVLKNSAGNYYVMKFDPSTAMEVAQEIIWPVHTWYYNGSSAIGALMVAPAHADGFSTTNPTLVIGDGTTADYLILPKPGLRPEDDSACRFETTTDRIAYGAFGNYRAQSFTKWLTRGDIEADDLDSDDTVTLQYQLPGGSATTIATANSDGRTTATISSEVEFTNVRYVVLLNNGGSSTSPVLQGLVLHAIPNPPRDQAFTFGVKIGDHIGLRGGTRDPRYDGATLETHLFDAKNERCTLIDPRGVSRTVKVLDVQPMYAKYDSFGRLETGFLVSVVPF